MKTLQVLIALFACAFLPLHAASLKDLTYATADGKISITDCDGAAKGKLVIPDTIDGKPVTSIRGDTFRDCTSLTSVTIGNGVNSIERNAFLGCTSLASINIPNSVEFIGTGAFSGCINLPKIQVGEKNNEYTDVNGVLFDKKKTLLLNYPAGKIDATYTIPDSVTSIGIYAFHKCLNLTRVAIPDSVTSIGDDAFSHCVSLTSITIGDGVTSIGLGAFWSLTSLTSITIPDSVTSIGGKAFGYCTSLTSITIPDGVTSIGREAFENCTKLTDITFQGPAPTVDADTFKGVADNTTAFVTPKALKSFGQVGDKWNGLTLKIGSASIATAPKEVAAGHSDEKELILLSSHLNTVEADFPALLREREVWKTARINAQLKIDTAYLAGLKKLKTSMVQNGEIAAARAIDQAIKGGTRTDDEPAVLTKSRQVRYDALLAAMKPIDQQYWKELKKVKEDVQNQGDLERIEIVLSEITRVLAPYK